MIDFLYFDNSDILGSYYPFTKYIVQFESWNEYLGTNHFITEGEGGLDFFFSLCPS